MLPVRLITIIWMWSVLSAHATKMPDAIWDGNHDPMLTGTCVNIYFAIQRNFMATAFGEIVEIAVMFGLPCCSSCILAPLVCGFAILQAVVCIVGLFTVLAADSAAVADCQDVYTCGCFVFVVLLILKCCWGCLRCCSYSTLGSADSEGAPLDPEKKNPAYSGAQ